MWDFVSLCRFFGSSCAATAVVHEVASVLFVAGGGWLLQEDASYPSKALWHMGFEARDDPKNTLKTCHSAPEFCIICSYI